MPKSIQKIETPNEAASRRREEIRSNVATEIPTRSDQIAYAFLRKDFVEAASQPPKASE